MQEEADDGFRKNWRGVRLSDVCDCQYMMCGQRWHSRRFFVTNWSVNRKNWCIHVSCGGRTCVSALCRTVASCTE